MKPLPDYIIAKTKGEGDKEEYVIEAINEKEEFLKEGDKILLTPKPIILSIKDEDNKFLIPISSICAVK